MIIIIIINKDFYETNKILKTALNVSKKGLEAFCVHPTAEELYFELKKNNPKLSLATVYRNLNQLAQNNVIKKIQGLSEQVHYDHNVSEHFHIICTECNKIEDLPKEMAESIRRFGE